MLDHLSRGRFDFGVGPRHRALRDGVLRPAPSRDGGDLPGGAGRDPPGAHQRRAGSSGAALHVPQGAHGHEAVPAAASAALVRHGAHGGRGVGRHQPGARDLQQSARSRPAAVHALPRGVAAQARRRRDAEPGHQPPRDGGGDRRRGRGAGPAELRGVVREPHQALARLRRRADPFRAGTSTRPASAASPSRARRRGCARRSSARSRPASARTSSAAWCSAT